MDERTLGLKPVARTVPVQLKTGAIVQVELSTEVPQEPFEEMVSGGKAVTFETAVEAIKGVCEQLTDALTAVAPRKFTIEMGFDFAVGPNGLTALFVKGDAKASVKVTMEWHRDNKP